MPKRIQSRRRIGHRLPPRPGPAAESRASLSAKMGYSGTIAIVGRPNVGKSTLFNRLIGRRRSIVGDEPGITRDRIYGELNWSGRTLRVIDTGGIRPQDRKPLPTEIYRQAKLGINQASAIIMIVDGRSELAAPDMELAQTLLRTGKPLFLAVNKIDTAKLEADIEDFRRLGISQVFPISAEHGNGIGDLLDEVLQAIPEQPRSSDQAIDRTPAAAGHAPLETKVAIIGRPNVGKSTLLNQLTGTSRAIVSPVAGTTRDAVDEIVERQGGIFRFIDTAGIRRKGKTHLLAEKLAMVMAHKHLEAADVALLVIDAAEGITTGDATIGGYAHQSGRSVIIAINKWDLVGSNRRDSKPPADRNLYEQQVRHMLKYLNYAPIVLISAVSGRNIEKLFEQIEFVARERRKRIPTGTMNRFLKGVDFDRVSAPASSQVKVYYMTQAAVAPPTFILFTDRNVKLHFSYQRFLEKQIRKAFGFVGTPIWIKNRARQK